ncbi:MAG TPA: hypothetical protein VIW24_01050 [Aldersonia sp.]
MFGVSIGPPYQPRAPSVCDLATAVLDTAENVDDRGHLDRDDRACGASVWGSSRERGHPQRVTRGPQPGSTL